MQNENGLYPIYGGNGILGYTNSSNANNVIVIGRVGVNCGNLFLEFGKCWINDNAIMAIPKCCEVSYLYWFMSKFDFNSQSEGSSQPLLTQAILNSQICVLPMDKNMVEFSFKAKPIMQLLKIIEYEIGIIRQLQLILLSGISNK